MRTLCKQIIAGFVAGLIPVAAPAAADETLPWLATFQQELRAAWVLPDVSMHGKVRFVTGNGIRPGGRQFSNGDNWLALACNLQACRLEPATLNVKNETGKGNRSAVQHLQFSLRVPSEAKVIAWFDTGAAPAWLKPGKVPAYYPGIGRPRETGKGTLEAQIDLPGGETASLVPMLLSDPDANGRFPPMLLQLRAHGKRQLLLGQLGVCTHTTDSANYLLWAGDLDNDGKADYLASFVDLDGPVHLYLSSMSKPGQLVGVAGVYNAPPSDGECDGGG